MEDVGRACQEAGQLPEAERYYLEAEAGLEQTEDPRSARKIIGTWAYILAVQKLVRGDDKVSLFNPFVHRYTERFINDSEKIREMQEALDKTVVSFESENGVMRFKYSQEPQ